MPNYNILIASILEHGLEALPTHCHLTPGKSLLLSTVLVYVKALHFDFVEMSTDELLMPTAITTLFEYFVFVFVY